MCVTYMRLSVALITFLRILSISTTSSLLLDQGHHCSQGVGKQSFFYSLIDDNLY